MNKTQSVSAMLLIGLGALGWLTGCVTSFDRTANGSNVDAANDTEEPSVILTDSGVAGQTATGERVYCRRMNARGSRLIETTCMTETQRHADQQRAKQMLTGYGR